MTCCFEASTLADMSMDIPCRALSLTSTDVSCITFRPTYDRLCLRSSSWPPMTLSAAFPLDIVEWSKTLSSAVWLGT